jgi:predicted peroxiredoxin
MPDTGTRIETPSMVTMTKSSSVNQIFVCPPCAGVRGYEKEDLIDGVTLAGSVAMLNIAKQEGAVTLSF